MYTASQPRDEVFTTPIPTAYGSHEHGHGPQRTQIRPIVLGYILAFHRIEASQPSSTSREFAYAVTNVILSQFCSLAVLTAGNEQTAYNGV